jgi:hypothetical protein
LSIASILVEWWVVEVGGGEGGAGHEMIRGMSRSLTLLG